tara:strand:+ start:913 stop:1824 length:912 start_codon:yes stop_codon:yes gene_type:complete
MTLNDLIQRKRGIQKKPMYDPEVHEYHLTLRKPWRSSTEITGIPSMDGEMELLTNMFKEKMHEWICNHKLISFTGLEAFPDKNVCLGVTHQLDELYIMHPNKIVIFNGDYNYHTRLFPNITKRTVSTLSAGDVLIMATPFTWFNNDVHPNMQNILMRCLQLNIPVHIDAAWYPCCRDINFNINHPAIQTITFSLSKAFGMGAHRIGLRYSRKPINGPIKIMNDYSYINVADMWTGLHFMKQFGTDFWWNKYEKHYNTLLDKCNLEPSKAIHVALFTDKKGNKIPIGVRKALLYLESGQIFDWA